MPDTGHWRMCASSHLFESADKNVRFDADDHRLTQINGGARGSR